MSSNTLIISDALVEPPSETWAFRTVTMISHENLALKILFHTTQNMKDSYYNFMKPRGLMDYIDYIINELEWEDGIRLDTTGIYPNTIVIKYIRLENQIYLLERIKDLSGIE